MEGPSTRGSLIPPRIGNRPDEAVVFDWSRYVNGESSLHCDSIEVQDSVKPVVLSARFGEKAAPVKSYFFSPLDSGSATAPADVPSKKAGTRPRPGNAATGRTRLLAPRDVIRLDDRLFYVLQPPLESLFASDTLEFPFEPFGFQYAGVAFLFPRQHAILADEMGLGKTMQAITSIRLLIRTGHARRILLICPKPLVTNWLREFAVWAPEVPVTAVQGNRAQRAWHWADQQVPVKIANYELLTRDEEWVAGDRPPFDLVVLDEAQRVKNPTNATSEVVHAIPRRRSWALTGTPIENGIQDLVGICEFVSPGTLDVEMSPRRIREGVQDLILRRTKDMVLTDMPPRLIRDAELELSPEQWDTYRKAEEEGVIRLNQLGHEITINHVFELVLRLKQICNFDPATGASTKTESLLADLEEVVASGEKAIVFSQWVDALDQIGERLAPYRPLAFHGRIPSGQRDGILKRFKESPDHPVLLMSYGAGSVGLNLQFCRYVFLFDRWWNPAVEDQAINRAHRIGAAGTVIVTRMIMSGTIEQRIHEILEEKRELFREILEDSDQSRQRGLTRDEVFSLFNLKTPKGKTDSSPNQRKSA